MILGKSLKGHDRNHIYVVYREEENYLYLVNGTTKTMDNPKKKNKLHVQLIKRFPLEVQSKIDEVSNLDDDVVEEIVNLYDNYLKSCIGKAN